jgi:hypothetical protein
MDRTLAGRLLGVFIATMLLAGCAGSGGGSPTPSLVDLPAVTDALRNSGIAVVDVADNLNPRDGAWRCLPGSFQLARVSQQPAAAFARPGDKPAVDILLFSSDAERTAAQAAIGADGQVRAQGCGVMVDWVATPHVVGAKNVLLFIATDDAAAFAAVRAAAVRLAG